MPMSLLGGATVTATVASGLATFAYDGGDIASSRVAYTITGTFSSTSIPSVITGTITGDGFSGNSATVTFNPAVSTASLYRFVIPRNRPACLLAIDRPYADRLAAPASFQMASALTPQPV